MFPSCPSKAFVSAQEDCLIQDATLNITRYDWRQFNKQKTSFSEYIKLEYNSNDEIKLHAI
jgi:hypothetical protein